MASRQRWRADVRPVDVDTTDAVVRDELEMLVRQGARQMLMLALNEEVDSDLGRGRYQRTEGFRGYRNGVTPRSLTVGSGRIELAVPRVRDVPEGQEPFESKILGRCRRRSDTVDPTFLNLFVEGLATRDFEPALRLLVGQDAPLSASTISRLTAEFRKEYEAFDKRDWSGTTFVSMWAEGVDL